MPLGWVRTRHAGVGRDGIQARGYFGDPGLTIEAGESSASLRFSDLG